MNALADTQAVFRSAVTGTDAPPAFLTAPRDVAPRLAIYRRHHAESLGRHIRGRFPTVEWLLGTTRMAGLADEFIHASPPQAPCMAEYGFDFVKFAAAHAVTQALPYLRDVAALDWHLGDVAVAVDTSPLSIDVLSVIDPNRLPDVRIALEPGTRYVASDWPIDELVRIRLSDNAPDKLSFLRQPVAIEVRGARGSFRLNRIDRAVLEFRAALAAGETIGFAIQRGAETDPQFDIPGALAAVFAEGLVAGLNEPPEGMPA